MTNYSTNGRDASDGGTQWWARFGSLLDADNDWPAEYLFKFIVPRDKLDVLQAVFGDHPVIVRASRRGRYVSVTATIEMASADEVIAIYRSAGKIDGVVSL